MEEIIKTFNPIVRVSKFTSNKKIEEEFEGYGERNFFQRGFITWVFNLPPFLLVLGEYIIGVEWTTGGTNTSLIETILNEM